VNDLNALPASHFGLILADPPWAFRTFTGGTRTPTQKKTFNEAEDHYPTMDFAAMAALPVGERAARDSLLAMWVVGSHLDEALALGQAWGFGYVTDLFYWCKQKLIAADQIDLFTGDIAEPKISMGYHTRKQLEPCLLFKRGKGLPVLNHGVRQIILEPPREHSRKPDAQYDRLTALYGDAVPRLELFARQARPGWSAWGNQVDKFDAIEVAA
jgi:N6-adenosine-specific RNA methylase IME4